MKVSRDSPQHGQKASAPQNSHAVRCPAGKLSPTSAAPVCRHLRPTRRAFHHRARPWRLSRQRGKVQLPNWERTCRTGVRRSVSCRTQGTPRGTAGELALPRRVDTRSRQERRIKARCALSKMRRHVTRSSSGARSVQVARLESFTFQDCFCYFVGAYFCCCFVPSHVQYRFFTTA